MLILLRWLAGNAGRLLLSFLIIVAVLALANSLPARIGEWRSEAENTQQVATALEEERGGFEQQAREAVAAADDEIARLMAAGEGELAQAEREIAQRREDARARVLDGGGLALAVARGQSDRVVASYRAQYVELPLLARTAELVALRRSNLRQSASLDQALRGHTAQVNAYNALVAERNRLQRQASGQLRNPLCRQAAMLPGCGLVRELRRRDADLQRRRQDLERDAQALRARAAAVRALDSGLDRGADSAAIVTRAADAYAAEARLRSEQAGGHALNQARDALRRYSGTAFWILLGAVLVPVLFKLFAFHAIAPLAARSRPIRLREGGSPLVASASGMSVEVPLDRDSEVLLRSGLQSSAADIQGGDQYLLDSRMPLTCIAAGLVNLQRLRSDRPDHLVVTGTDQNHRVAAIEVPAGGAVVLQPRALLGVKKPRGSRLAITRPWRLNRLISWITAQFRYVVFHGPCTLIVQGRDGVVVEEASRGRMIDKRLTLGFDAGLGYGAARSASFLPFLRGQASLFNDRFEGTGRYLYEQRGATAGPGSIWGRGLKGIGDGVLKAFGI